jgi:hypothetical protein
LRFEIELYNDSEDSDVLFGGDGLDFRDTPIDSGTVEGWGWHGGICTGHRLVGLHILWSGPFGADFDFFVQEQTKSICIEQIEHHIESFFTGIFRLSIAKLIRRNFGFTEGYWDADSCIFYRFSGPGQQGHQKG